MRVIVVGASGAIGKAVVEELATAGHDVIGASRRGDLKVDIEKPQSIRAMYRDAGIVDAVISCAGEGSPATLAELTDDQIAFSLSSKLMGQVNLVRLGLDWLTDGGALVLTAGIFGQHPLPGVPIPALVDGALESFARAAALDLPRGLRIATISPPYLTETAAGLGMSTKGTISAKANASYYRSFVEGEDTGLVIFPLPDS